MATEGDYRRLFEQAHDAVFITSREGRVLDAEAAAVRDFDRAAETLRSLLGAGVRVALDDFGTGQSTLQQLKHLPVDMLKIDTAFVDGIGEDLRDEELIRAVLGVGDGPGLGVVAEGVEREEPRRWLEREGCDLLQGFLVGRPGPVEAVEPGPPAEG